MSMIPNQTLVVIADGGSARFFRNAGDEANLQLVQDKTFDETAAAETAPAGSQPKDIDRDESAFAHFVAKKLNASALNHKFDHLIVAADPITLGEMRKIFHTEVTNRMIAEVAKDWTNTPKEQIIKALDELKIA